MRRNRACQRDSRAAQRNNRHGLPILTATPRPPTQTPEQQAQRRAFEQQLDAKGQYWDARLAAQLAASRSYKHARVSRAYQSDSR